MKKIILISLFFLCLFAFLGVFNPKNYQFSSLENDMNLKRKVYYSQTLGRIYGNRVGVFYFDEVYPKYKKVETNIFTVFGKTYVYLPLFGIVLYKGLRKK